MVAFVSMSEATGTLAIMKPENDAVSCAGHGKPDGRLPNGRAGDAQLWWFADGRAVGESSGARPFAVALGRGEHVLTCATIAGITSSVRIKIQ